MKIVSWNVNGLRAVHRGNALLPFVKEYSPDILLLQEIKGHAEQFAAELQKDETYEIRYHSAEKAGYAGTGIWVKSASDFKVDEFVTGMPALDSAQGDYEGRICGVRGVLKGVKTTILGIYFPNGGKSDAAFEEKLVFYKDFLAYVETLTKRGEQCFWGGDINCAHTPIDLARPKENDGKVGFHPRERAWLDNVVTADWVDIFRDRYPDLRDQYSWWSYRSGARENNVGWRIDYFFTKRQFLNQVKSISYLTEVKGSDHCPLWMELH